MRLALLLATLAAGATAHASTLAYDGHALVALDADAFVDSAASADEIAHLRADRAPARERLAAAIGALVSAPPLEVYCKSDACRLHFAGPSRRSCVRMPGDAELGDRWAADRATIVMVRIDDVLGTLVHELFHIELRERLGAARVPAWFNEGMAAHFGDNTPGCAPTTPKGIDDLRRLDSGALWFSFTDLRGRIELTYCQARHEAEAWLAKGDTERFGSLVRAVHDGGDFSTLYGRLLTQDNGAFPSVLMTQAYGIGDPKRPFSFALWVKPAANEGTLVHVSSTVAGTGWCDPFLGFDASHALVAQVNHDVGPDPSAYTIARSKIAPRRGRWTHVAMTWAPGAMLRLYLDGKEVAATPSAGYRASGEPSMYVTWASPNIAGATACWQGAIVPGRFAGDVVGMESFDKALTVAEIAEMARRRP